MAGLVNFLSLMERQPLWDTMAKEVVGINAPKIIFTRSNDERIDVATNELGNTVGFVATGFLLEKALDFLYEKAVPASKKALENTKTWEALGRSFTLYSLIFSVMWAMPFIRNYYTAKRTGQVQYTHVIGAKNVHQPEKKAYPSNQVQEKMAEYRNKALSILGLGALFASAASVASVFAIGKGAGVGPMAQWVAKNLALIGGKFSDFSGVKALLFWGLPAYGGWIHASRDPIEKKEQLLKFFNFVFCFSVPQQVMKWYFNSGFEKLLGKNMEASFAKLKSPEYLTRFGADIVKKATRLKLFQEGAGLVSSIVLLGISPAVLNIFLTQKRLDQLKPSPYPATTMRGQSVTGWDVPRGQLQYKSFEAFARGA
jgi:hypothetical protein